jgi:hypothetical protein
MEQAIEKLRERRKHWDQVYQQYHINNYHYIDCHGILHENMTYFIDGEGTTHETPLQYLAEYGTAYDTLDYESQTVEADDQHKCYQSFSPRRRIPKLQHAQKYLSKKKQAYKTAAISADDQGNDITNNQNFISRQKQLSDDITNSVWEEKEHVRLQERIKNLQNQRKFSRRHYTRIERACVAIATGEPPLGEVSITDSEMEPEDTKLKAPTSTSHDELKRTTDRYEQQTQQLFSTLQAERKQHQDRMNETPRRLLS